MRGHPSLRWILKRLASHIHQSALILHQPSRNANRTQREELYQRDLEDSKIFLTDFLNSASTENFISSQMWEILYDQALGLIEDHRSQDLDFVLGALEPSLSTFFPHDQL